MLEEKMLEEEEEKINLNVIILGDKGVGKSSIIQIIKNGEIKEHSNDLKDNNGNFILKRKYEKKKKIILLHLKEPEYQQILGDNIPIQYYRDSHIVLLVFCDIKTLNSIKDSWYKSYKEKANIKNSRFILIGNKSDTFGDDKKEIEKQGNKFAEEIDAQFLMCSTNSEDNKDNLDRYITTEAKRYIDEEEKDEYVIQKSQSFKVRYDDDNAVSKPCGGCRKQIY